MIYYAIFSVISYFIGSINTAIIISKKVYGKDIRTLESKNAGATNMMRAFGKKAGIIVFLLDFSKGVLSVLIAKTAVSISMHLMKLLCLQAFSPFSVIYFLYFSNSEAGKALQHLQAPLSPSCR